METSQVLTVTEITRRVKNLLEDNFRMVWVLGEVSNCTRAASGHVYLTLKDDSAQLRAVIWRNAASRLKFELHDGLEVVAAGPLELYQARGTYQLIIEQLIPQGVGALELAFRQMQEKLAAEGLFDADHKQPLPRFPRRIALITSPTSAAVRDMVQVITRRWRGSDVIVLPVSVQGDGAAEQIAGALRSVVSIPAVDVVICGRGGGSLEDLWAFNEEIVARAIYDCPIPVISAVGHEIDVSIADLVADRRALTPSEAGELAVPLKQEVASELRRQHERMSTLLGHRIGRARAELDGLSSRRVFARPLERVHHESTRLDELAARLAHAVRSRVDTARGRSEQSAAALEALSPRKVLERGYSITQRADSGEIVRQADRLQPGERITTILNSGQLTSTVESIAPEQQNS